MRDMSSMAKAVAKQTLSGLPFLFHSQEVYQTYEDRNAALITDHTASVTAAAVRKVLEEDKDLTLAYMTGFSKGQAHAAAKDAEIARLRVALQLFITALKHKRDKSTFGTPIHHRNEVTMEYAEDEALRALAAPAAQTVGEVG